MQMQDNIVRALVDAGVDITTPLFVKAAEFGIKEQSYIHPMDLVIMSKDQACIMIFEETPQYKNVMLVPGEGYFCCFLLYELQNTVQQTDITE
jgi:hypothetical protein